MLFDNDSTVVAAKMVSENTTSLNAVRVMYLSATHLSTALGKDITPEEEITSTNFKILTKSGNAVKCQCQDGPCSRG